MSVNHVPLLSTGLTEPPDYQAPHPPSGTPAHATNYPGANPYQSVKAQKAFEKGLLEKTVKTNGDIIM
jgi:hypothetical protein